MVNDDSARATGHRGLSGSRFSGGHPSSHRSLHMGRLAAAPLAPSLCLHAGLAGVWSGDGLDTTGHMHGCCPPPAPVPALSVATITWQGLRPLCPELWKPALLVAPSLWPQASCLGGPLVWKDPCDSTIQARRQKGLV